MKLAETVTFGGSGMDRAAMDRANPQALQAHLTDATARAILLWRGKPLVSGRETLELTRLPMSHAVVQSAQRDPVFLGLEVEGPRFGVDISEWTPAEQDTTTVGAFVDPSEQVHPDLDGDVRFVELRQIMARLNPRDAELAATARAIHAWHDTHGFCAKCGAPSDITHAGWQRTCPACGAHHFPRTDPVVIMLITHGNSVLLGRSHGWPEWMYSLLAGFVEPGETLEAAVRRETFEEAGVKVAEVNYLASQPWPFPSSLMVGCAGRATGRALTIDPAEIENAIWATREEIADAFAGANPNLKPARKGSIAQFLLQHWLSDTLD